ncbi:NAD(P)/FAD-dependent oxidoreductase [Actinomycetospora termitidis]|uniref:FAD-dependent oxidoreductase n=1 Tax=Actinomycetospora termitidis TaxID=3053470 RepID=A0ABT7M6G4_9PSEU|nr:FAD-dependent oxidoreductase [Actinomycetospora sp. Odt1-22]MDL5155834.1 FAD-dependent oxidoreductase [Actinomycetospora sp. Odt1-22]
MADLVVVGASLAGLRAVEAVRNDGWSGSIALVGSEEHLPYDRPPLSKEHLADDEPGDLTYREREKLAELDVELVLGAPAEALDLEGRTLTVGGRDLSWSGLVVATGAHARTLPASVCDPDLRGVVTLRTLDDSRHLRDLLRDGTPRVTVIGAGFIGSEIAAVARKRDLEVTIVEALPVPLVRGVGERMGRALTAIHERQGTTVRTGVSVEKVTGNGRVESVVLADGTEIPTDVLVVGIGAAPNTGWLESSGLTISDGVVADATLRAAPGVYTAGDVARWPNALFDDVLTSPMRLEHWTSASEQGALAARNAVDPSSAKEYTTVPYFWSDWYDSRIQFVGVSRADEGRPEVETEIVMGSEDDGAFVALYRSGDRLVGALAVDKRAEVMQYRRLILNRASWEDGLAKAEERRERAAKKAAAS